jgi:membrane-associated phospholipid phosphatase
VVTGDDGRLLPAAWARPGALTVGLGALWVLGWALAVEGTDGPLGLDGPVDDALARTRPALGGLASVVAGASHPGHFAVLLLAVVAVCLLGGSRRAVAVLVVAVAAELVVCEALKDVVDRHLVLGPLTFPSGHVATASTVATVLVLLARPGGPLAARRGRTFARLVAVGAVASVPVVAASMILLGDHYFSDTVAAAPLGLAVTLLAAALVDRLAPRLRPGR